MDSVRTSTNDPRGEEAEGSLVVRSDRNGSFVFAMARLVEVLEFLSVLVLQFCSCRFFTQLRSVFYYIHSSTIEFSVII